MFTQLTVLAFVAVILGMFFHFLLKPVVGVSRSPWGIVQMKTRALLKLLPSPGLPLIGLLKRLALAVAMVCFVILLVTGFLPLLLGQHLTGYVLMLHVSCAPVLVVCVAFLGVTWAYPHIFTAENGYVLLRVLGISPSSSGRAAGDLGLMSKCCFWLLLLLSLPLTMSMILSMFPLFGTTGQVFLVHVHRYSALGFSLVVMIYGYNVMRALASTAKE
jgi:hypothetical protein